MSRYEKKNKEKDPTTKGVAAPASGSFSELDSINIERTYGKRHLAWNLIVYPGESLPEDWKSILGELMIPWAISPLHDEDINETGEKKKAHRHLLLAFHTVKSHAQIKEIAMRLGSAPPKPCLSTRGMVRYFLHLDNPEKAQYKRENIECGGGFDLENALKKTATEEEAIIEELCEFIRTQPILDFCDLDEYVRTQRKEWCFILHQKCYYWNQLIKSQRCKYGRKRKYEGE